MKMIRSAEDARKLANKQGQPAQIHKALTDTVQEKIYEAAKNGMGQVTVEFPHEVTKVLDFDVLKKELKDAGYGIVVGQSKGFFGSGLFKEPKVSITVVW
jgi:hypothetical protein